MSQLSPKRGLKQMQVEGAKTFGIFLHFIYCIQNYSY